MNTETILTNAVLVLPDETVSGTVVLHGEMIAEIAGRTLAVAAARSISMATTLIPGVVDVHTDNLERQVQPRSLARWPSRSAMVAHDAQCAAAGVTTVLDALCLGDLGFDTDRIHTFRDGVVDLDALTTTGLLKSEHFLHLRCEVPALDMLELFDPVADHPLVRMISLMDHSPGVGQYANLDFYRNLRRQGGLDEATIDRRIIELQEQRARLREPNRRALLDRVRGPRHRAGQPRRPHRGGNRRERRRRHSHQRVPGDHGGSRAAKAAGMQVIAGAPNIVRGGSHSGNVAAADLLRAGAVDAFASDYVPPSLVEAAFRARGRTAITLPEAVAMITDRPARMAGLPDRGRLAAGMRADLVRVRLHDTLPVVRQVWRAGSG